MKKSSRIPQWVAKNIDLTKWGIPQEHVEVLQQGPKHATYWRIWTRVLHKAERIVDGKKYKLLLGDDKNVLIASKCFDLDSRAF